MAIETREIYKIDQNTGERTYAGYGKFEGDQYLGSFGGNGTKSGKSKTKTQKASQVQRTINSVSARQEARRPSILSS